MIALDSRTDRGTGVRVSAMIAGDRVTEPAFPLLEGPRPDETTTYSSSP